jgi:hypothetical protein
VFEAAAQTAAGNQTAQVQGDAPKLALTMDSLAHSPIALALDQNISFSAQYSANIRNIEMDGTIFQLDNDEEKK